MNERSKKKERETQTFVDEIMSFFSSPRTRHLLVEKSGVLHIYYANKPFKHWKKRWLHLQDQDLSIYQGKFSIENRHKNYFFNRF